MSALFLLALPACFAALLSHSTFPGQGASGLTWSALARLALISVFVTLFAFLGANMFVSRLHSYGEL